MGIEEVALMVPARAVRGRNGLWDKSLQSFLSGTQVELHCKCVGGTGGHAETQPDVDQLSVFHQSYTGVLAP